MYLPNTSFFYPSLCIWNDNLDGCPKFWNSLICYFLKIFGIYSLNNVVDMKSSLSQDVCVFCYNTQETNPVYLLLFETFSRIHIIYGNL